MDGSTKVTAECNIGCTSGVTSSLAELYEATNTAKPVTDSDVLVSMPCDTAPMYLMTVEVSNDPPVQPACTVCLCSTICAV